MTQINLNVQGISSPSCIAKIKEALLPLGDIQTIHVDWESGRVQIERIRNQYDDLIHALSKTGYLASLDLDE